VHGGSDDGHSRWGHGRPWFHSGHAFDCVRQRVRNCGNIGQVWDVRDDRHIGHGRDGHAWDWHIQRRDGERHGHQFDGRIPGRDPSDDGGTERNVWGRRDDWREQHGRRLDRNGRHAGHGESLSASYRTRRDDESAGNGRDIDALVAQQLAYAGHGGDAEYGESESNVLNPS